MFEYDKPAIPFEQQVNRLADEYGLSIPNHAQAVGILKTLSYYDLMNGYQEVLLDPATNRFVEDFTFEKLYHLFSFDRDVQSVLFRFSVHCESKFKNVLSHEIAFSIGQHQDEYLDEAKYQHEEKYDLPALMAKFRAIYDPPEDSKGRKRKVDQPTKHYLRKKNIPPWILLKNATFNDCIDLYRVLPNQVDKPVKLNVARSLISNTGLDDALVYEYTSNAITMIRQFRNAIAHNLKFITFRTRYPIQFKLTLKTVAGSKMLAWKDHRKKIGSIDLMCFIVCVLNFLEPTPLAKSFTSALEEAFASGERKYGKEIVAKYIEATRLPHDIMLRLECY